jgi:hypothetical protein
MTKKNQEELNELIARYLFHANEQRQAAESMNVAQRTLDEFVRSLVVPEQEEVIEAYAKDDIAW